MLRLPYRSYLYSYPHKTAYREFPSPLPLRELWASEPAESFFLYMHIPFCGARCGFCNLFTLPDKRANVHEQYVDALERQARQWGPVTSHKPYARFAIGGGTPTLLPARQLKRLFDIAVKDMKVDLQQVSISVETSPETITKEKLAILRDHRVDRVSMGIQSFVAEESAAIFRPQDPAEVYRALDKLTKNRFPILNLDLIYGLPGQTEDTWMYSLQEALRFDPEEIFLYPLYTREHTIVKPDDIRQHGEDQRLAYYTLARDYLIGRGYVQSSMRRFAKAGTTSMKQLLDYSCQEEGMVGLGCGARSYTRHVHYASRYGVSRQATASIIADYVAADDYSTADYGFVLGPDEQKRRFILKALLHREGLRLADYHQRFGSLPADDYPELNLPLLSGMAYEKDGTMYLSDEGLSCSDAIGDWLISAEVRERMEGFVLA
ncbi:STM4012 family radical SAM protein [Paenibacillus sp. JX-17]|uniref:Heme chaperone HemW n=1 Tax=Paenibacillus lacisoli TaxID=3064525 RepID=A0ABT9C721_9BACL|nr:STM4012 family radical SAM protein [Paenibacillus sp. JX-17]MDO7905058.1 STM4012 family radical SAM protein [Paenibacillus sp. JX-17]